MALNGPDDAAILQAARAWLKGSGGGLTDAQVIPLDDKGPRPALPYLAVGVFANRPGGGGVAQPGILDTLDSDDDPQRAGTMRRDATISVQAFGRTAARWVHEADLRLSLDAVQSALDTAGVVIVPGGSSAPSVIDRGVGREYRTIFDFEARVRLTTDPESVTAADRVDLTTDLRQGDGSVLTTTTAIDL